MFLIGLLSHQSDFESILTLRLKIRLSVQSLFEFFYYTIKQRTLFNVYVTLWKINFTWLPELKCILFV